jgi:hypothetical protein
MRVFVQPPGITAIPNIFDSVDVTRTVAARLSRSDYRALAMSNRRMRDALLPNSFSAHADMQRLRMEYNYTHAVNWLWQEQTVVFDKLIHFYDAKEPSNIARVSGFYFRESWNPDLITQPL